MLTNAFGVNQAVNGSESTIDTALNFQTANVENTDTTKTSFYVVYSEADYGSKDVGTACLVPADFMSGSSEPVTTDFNIQSAQGFNVETPGIALFQHYKFIGYAQGATSSNPDITSSFPIGEIDGASSVICTGGEWQLYTGKNFTEAYYTVQKGQCVTTLEDVGLNDKIRSVKFIKLP